MVPIVENGKITREYPINFREDPRKLKDIKINITNSSAGRISFVKIKTVYISIGNVPQCSDNLIAVVGLTAFLTDFGGLDVKGAMSNKTEAMLNNLTYLNCKTNLNNTVIEIVPGLKNSITRTSENCYELEVRNCEINRVTERMSLLILEDYMGYFEIKNPSFLDKIKNIFA